MSGILTPSCLSSGALAFVAIASPAPADAQRGGDRTGTSAIRSEGLSDWIDCQGQNVEPDRPGLATKTVDGAIVEKCTTRLVTSGQTGNGRVFLTTGVMSAGAKMVLVHF